ncbi:MAG: uroporphyrinogen-III synthase [Bacteroidales bacterium]
MKIKNVLISQPQPENEKNPYADVAKLFNLDLTFRKFIKIESIGAKEFRSNRIHIPDFTSVIFTSKNAVDHFFNLCESLRIQVSDQMKYFCTSEAIALYLQKYVQYRKRKIFFGKSQFGDLLDIIKKQKDEKYLFPCAENHSKDIPQLLTQHKIDFISAPIYRTVPNDLSDLELEQYQMLIFFSPFGVESLKKNFPDYQQGEAVVAAFGEATAEAVEKEGYSLSIKAPTETAPSMAMAVQEFLQKNGRK